MKSRLVLIDSNAVVHRAYHALPALSNKKGELLNAVYGFSLIFINMIRDLKPSHIIATFDVKAKTLRHKKFKEYKAKRIKKPEEFYEQFPKVKAVLEAFNVPIIEKAGYEADDIIATLAKKSINSVDEVIIVTGDMDTLCLVNDPSDAKKASIKVWAMKQGLTKTEIYDEKKAYERYGFDPKLLLEYKGLRGDASDNIPGVAGIGEKTATELIKNYKTLDMIYKNLKNLPERQARLLSEQKDSAYLSRELGELDENVDIDYDLEKARFEILNRQKIVDIFQKYEFKSLMNKIPKAGKDNMSLFSSIDHKPKHQNKYQLISNQKEFDQLIKNLSKSKVIAFDVETDRLDMITGKLLGISFGWKKEKAAYLPIETQSSKIKMQNDNLKFKIEIPASDCHSALAAESIQIDKNYHIDSRLRGNDKKKCRNDNYDAIKRILQNPSIKKIGHNIKYDWAVLYRYGINTNPLYFDTMIASYLLNTQSRAHSLDNIAFIELGYETQKIEELIGIGKDQKSLDQVDVEKLAQYSAEDSDLAYQLYLKFLPRIESEGLSKLFYEIEMPMVKVLSQMELSGIKLNNQKLSKLNKLVSSKISKLKSQIYKHAGSEFNINSTQQLRKVLFEDLKISTQNIKKTKTGHSTAAAELEKLKGAHKIIDLIHEHRELTKIKNTYLDALPKMTQQRHSRNKFGTGSESCLAGEGSPKTHHLHTSFNQAITTSGRLSSSNPNLQNIPIRTDLGQQIRRAFEADKGKKIVAFDYSQIELRVAAHFSNDLKMIEAFKNKEDIHTATASEIFGKPLDQVTKSERRKAKTVNFGILYGISAYGLAQTLSIRHDEAQGLIDRYFESFPKVKKYCDDIINKVRESGFVDTLYGHRRYLSDINSSIAGFRNAAERMAVNHPIQGTAAEIIKLAMVEIDKAGLVSSKDCKLLLQVHDELVFEINEKIIKKQETIIKQIMEKVVKLKVPIEVDVEIGDNWGELSTFAKGEAGVPARAKRDAGK